MRRFLLLVSVPALALMAMVIPDLAPSGIATILTLYNDATGQTITAAGQQYGSG